MLQKSTVLNPRIDTPEDLEETNFDSNPEDDLKEADSEDIEAFFHAHENDNGPVLGKHL